MRRLGSLDGIRGVAVLTVLASHLIAVAHGGYLGVDVFFVLSGYLITSLLLVEHARSGGIDFAGFYRRRLARLFPAYVLMLCIAIPIISGPLRHQMLIAWPWAVALTAVYGANWAGVANVDLLGPIQHTWSLSIEEQFYLIWPVTLLLLLRRKVSLRTALIGATVVVVLLRAVGWLLVGGDWAYVATFTHSDGLLIGALLAVALDRHRGETPDARTARRYERQAWAGVAVLAGCMATLEVSTAGNYLFGITAAGLATAAIVRFLVTVGTGPIARAASWRPLVGVGRISYGLYLYHMPIFRLVQSRHLPFVPAASLQIVITLGVAVASWYLLELPFQRWVHRRWPRRTPTDAAVSAPSVERAGAGARAAEAKTAA